MSKKSEFSDSKQIEFKVGKPKGTINFMLFKILLGVLWEGRGVLGRIRDPDTLSSIIKYWTIIHYNISCPMRFYTLIDPLGLVSELGKFSSPKKDRPTSFLSL